MGDEGSVHHASGLGVIADHPLVTIQPVLVAPTDATEFNTMSLDIVPVACLCLSNALFDFDSSFVNRKMAKMLAKLPQLRKRHANARGELPPMAVFGHADPVGDDEYNKQLSGRRAKAVYGVLTHQTSFWESLYNSPFGGDNWQTGNTRRVMEKETALPAGTPLKKLIAAYMALLCPQPATPAEFIGRGADPKGKADFQGCGEFNPLLLLSTNENATLSQSKRNLENLPNRRVVVFLFRPGTHVNASLWPCPVADQATAACRQRFFADGDARRAAGPKRRERDSPRDQTFACRFYSRIAQTSPCERILKAYQIRLFDVTATPLPFARWTVFDGNDDHVGIANKDAFLTIQNLQVPATCKVKWSPAGPSGAQAPDPKPDDDFDFELDVHIDIEEGGEQASLDRLHNLGYFGAAQRADDIRAFQLDNQSRFPAMTPNGALDPATVEAIRNVHEECDPSIKRSGEAE